MWAATDHFNILGTTFAVQATDPSHAELVRMIFAPFLLDHRTGVPARHQYGLVGTEEGKVVAYGDCRRLGAPTDLGGAILSLAAALNRSAIEAYTGFAVHAGVVAKQGKVTAFPVDTGGGKSTLVAACLLAGFEYVSDEALCIDTQTAEVVVYPKPLALSATSCDLLQVSPDSLTVPTTRVESLGGPGDLRAPIANGQLQLNHLVIPEFGHNQLLITELPASEAMATLLKLSFNHYKLGETAFRLAARLASEVKVWRLLYSDPLQAASSLSNRVG